MTIQTLGRTYLFVPPEEYVEVGAAGAAWDDDSKRWYVPFGAEPTAFLRWMEEEEHVGESEYSIISEESYVACAETSCLHCRAPIEVICLYCESGEDIETGEVLERFTVSNIWAVDETLAVQLRRWPLFNKGGDSEPDHDHFANHCPHCGTLQEDYLLHSEPGDVFFALSRTEPRAVTFVPLAGRVQLGGDFAFEV